MRLVKPNLAKNFAIFAVAVAAASLSGCSDRSAENTNTAAPAVAAAEVSEVRWDVIDLKSLKSDRLRDGLNWIEKHDATKAAAFLVTEIKGSAFGDPTEEEVKEEELFDKELEGLIKKQPALGIAIGDLLRTTSEDNGFRWYSLSEKHGSKIAATRIAEVRATVERQAAESRKASEAKESATHSSQAAAAQNLPGGTVVQTKVGGVMCGDLYSMKAFIETSKPGECFVAQVSKTTRVLNTPTNTPGWVFVYVNDRTAGLIRSSDLTVVESTSSQATQGAAQGGWFIAEGATICTELRAINRAIALQRAGHIAGLPDECLLSPRTMSVRVMGNSPMPGISVVQVGTEQGFVRNEDLISR